MEFYSQLLALIILGALALAAIGMLIVVIRELASRDSTGANKFFSWLGQALSEAGGGGPSSMRLMIFFLNIAFISALAFVLIWVVIYYPQYILTLVPMYLSAVLIGLGFKKLSKGDEQTFPTPGDGTDKSAGAAPAASGT